ncbi:MAG: Rpn family recombination-promoting nuclease/putative transposase [Spirochaetaceae bacterium]|nr:Rpn family recombination-promoting nuclease/putative transposase [Spirochaetaceae bacterium]
MAKLEYTFKNDTLFKMLFVKNPDLLKRLVAELLGVQYCSIGKFAITNPEMPPEAIGDKFCRLGINMTVDGQRVDLEIQVRDESDFPERTLFHWAREYSTSLGEGDSYIELPQVVIISIVAFRIFACREYHSEFQALEVTRHILLTDRMSLQYYELPKLPGKVSADNALELWLKLFDADTEEELRQIEELEVPVMQQAIGAYRSVTAEEEFRTLERMRSDARRNEASALANARREAVEETNAKWQGVVKEKDAKWQGVVKEKDTALAKNQAALAEKDAEIARLRAMLGENK